VTLVQTAACVIVTLLLATQLRTAVAESTSETSLAKLNQNLLFSETCDGGILFIDGSYVASPYCITATADSVFVNGAVLDVNFDQLRNERGISDGKPRRRRDNGENQHRDSFRPSSTIRQAESLTRELRDNDGIVFVFAQTSMICLDRGKSQNAFYDVVLADRSERHLDELMSCLPNTNQRLKIEEWLSGFQPGMTLRSQLLARRNVVDAIEDEGMRKAAALRLMDRLAYPLTIVAMLLGVIALGHMLKWTAQSIVSNQGQTISKESVRGAEIALLLMAGMSVVDLVWTIVAGQAGVMREVNPLAAGFIDSPMALAAFKVTATALGFALLYALRTKPRGQEVTWWMCLVCVLVTFRWVMFDSMNA